MNKKTAILLLLLLIIGAFLIISTQQTYAASESDGLYENIEDAAKESGDTNLINNRDNYEIDTEKISFFKDPSSVIFNMATNFIFTLQRDFSKLLIVVFDFSMGTSISTILETFIEPFITGMKNTIFERFAVFMISICAFWFLIKIVTNRQSQVFSNMLSLIAIIVVAFAFFAYPVQLLKGLDNVSNEMANAVMDAPYDTISGDDNETISSKGKSSAVIWNLFVHKPWQLIEFGSVSKAQQFENDILKHKPGSDERKKAVQEIAEKENLFSKELSYQSGRCATAFILLLINIFLIIVLMLLCILILGYQFLLLLYVMLGIFVFLLALIPYYGMELVKKWGLKLLGAACMKVLLVFFLSILMVFMSVLYGYTDKFGLLCTMLIIIVMVSMIYLKKDEIIGLFSEFNIGSINFKTPEQMINRAMDQDANVLSYMRNSKLGADISRQESGEFSGKNNESNNVLGNTTSSKEYTSQFRDLKDSTENITKTIQDMSKYFTKAEDLLQKSYDKSKSESEEKAVRNNTEVEYGNFVNRTDAIREMGIGSFDARDISSVANLVRSVELKGGDVEKIIDTNSDYINKPKIQRPSNLQDSLAKSGDQRVAEPPVSVRVGNEYFKNAFGDEKGENFYENMKKKYNPAVVEKFGSAEKLTYSQIQRELKSLSQMQKERPQDDKKEEK